MTVKVSDVATIEACLIGHETIPLEDRGKCTMGQFLDDYLVNAFREGVEVQSVTLRFTPEQWEAQKRILSQLR